MAHFRYEATEYFVTGVASGKPYKTRLVVRRPSDSARFSGIVLAEILPAHMVYRLGDMKPIVRRLSAERVMERTSDPWTCR